MKFKSILLALMILMVFIGNQIKSEYVYITSVAQFEEQVLQRGVWAAVNFYVTSSPIFPCTLCQEINAMLSMIDLKGWAKANNIKLFAVNATLLPTLASRYSFGWPPTLLMFSQGIQTGQPWQIKQIPDYPILESRILSSIVR